MDRWKNILKKEARPDNELRGVYKRSVGGWEREGWRDKGIACNAGFDHPHAIEHAPLALMPARPLAL